MPGFILPCAGTGASAALLLPRQEELSRGDLSFGVPRGFFGSEEVAKVAPGPPSTCCWQRGQGPRSLGRLGEVGAGGSQAGLARVPAACWFFRGWEAKAVLWR